MHNNSYKYKDVDFVGQRHGKLQVIAKANHGRSWLICKCDCGNVKEMLAYKFYECQSCGCLEKENMENLGEHNKTHGMTNTRLYRIWCKMKERCNNPNIEHYDRYGGRGIKVCNEWSLFENFASWANASGYKESLNGKEQSLDRIDVNGNYEPSNCRWVNHKTQCRNRTNNSYILFNGEKITISEFCEINGITYNAFVRRKLKKGLTPIEIINSWESKHGDKMLY